jgi:hypothetical protein
MPNGSKVECNFDAVFLHIWRSNILWIFCSDSNQGNLNFVNKLHSLLKVFELNWTWTIVWCSCGWNNNEYSEFLSAGNCFHSHNFLWPMSCLMHKKIIHLWHLVFSLLNWDSSDVRWKCYCVGNWYCWFSYCISLCRNSFFSTYRTRKLFCWNYLHEVV